MPAKRKRGGRVTPKGTVNPSKKKAATQGPAPTQNETPRHLRRANLEKGRGSRPISHNRGNR